MEPKEFDIEFPRGDTCPISFVLEDNSGKILLPGTGDELYLTLKKNYGKSDAILQKRFSRGDFIIQDGIISCIFSHSDTAELKYGTYYYDIELISGDCVRTVILGTITLTNEATWLSNE